MYICMYIHLATTIFFAFLDRHTHRNRPCFYCLAIHTYIHIHAYTNHIHTDTSHTSSYIHTYIHTYIHRMVDRVKHVHSWGSHGIPHERMAPCQSNRMHYCIQLNMYLCVNSTLWLRVKCHTTSRVNI